MGYESEELAAVLKAARERKGLSQRALSARAGVPQPHISKIESGAVNLTVASLTAIANALDLELALVPREAVPAVQSITRNLGGAPMAAPQTRKELARLSARLEEIRSFAADSPALGQLQRQLRDLSQFAQLIADPAPLRKIRAMLAAVRDTASLAALDQAVRQMDKLRSSLAQGNGEDDRPRPARPAYRLDDDGDE